MDAGKKAQFVKAMGRQKFSKGGLIRKLGNRKYFATGGETEQGTKLGASGQSGFTNNASNGNTGVLGTIGGSIGLMNNYQAAGANIQQGTNGAQLNNAYTGAQQGLANQQGMVDTLTPQVGTGVANQNALSGQLYDMTQGRGPNPAQTELNQNTAANVAQTGSQMAGARGASGNVGLMARQIGEQGANTQQQAVGQEATLKAQQQVAAQQNLANLSNNQISQAGQATTGLNTAQQNEQNILQNANTSANNANVGMQSNMNSVNAGAAGANQNMVGTFLGGGLGGASSSGNALYKGGEVKDHHIKLAEMNSASLIHSAAKNYDDGGEVEPDLGNFKSDMSGYSPSSVSSAPEAGSSKVGKGGGGGSSAQGLAGMVSTVASLFDEGGKVNAPIGPNPLVTGQQAPINNTGNWVAQYANSGGPSSGPNVNTSVAPSGGKKGGGNNNLIGAGKAAYGYFSKDHGSNPVNQTNEQAQQDQMNTELETHPDFGPQTEEMQRAGTETELPAKNGSGEGLESIGENVAMAAHGGQMHPNYCHGPHKSHVANYLFAEGGKVPAMVSPGEIYLSPENVRRVKEEGIDPAKIGEKFKGKAKVKGDSLKNDTIPRDLEEGGVVIDRKNMSTREKRELFVHKATARKKAGR